MWQYGYQNGSYYVSSYAGEHYTSDLGVIDLHFNISSDGLEWVPVNEER